MTFDRITSDPKIMNRKPCIRGMSVTVSLILNLIANGMTEEQIIEDYPYIEPEDITQCIQYTSSLSNRFAGKLPANAARKLQDHIQKSREEWDS